MTLVTHAELPFRAPLRSVSEKQIPVGKDALILADLTGLRVKNVRGAMSTNRRTKATWASEVGEVRLIDHTLAVGLTAEEWMVIAEDHPNLELQAGDGDLLTVTDISHGLGILLIAGRDAAETLSKLSAVDFSDRQFPNHRAVQTSLAKVRATLIRRDCNGRHTFVIAVGRSVADYVWRTLLDAAGEFDPHVTDGTELVADIFAAN